MVRPVTLDSIKTLYTQFQYRNIFTASNKSKIACFYGRGSIYLMDRWYVNYGSNPPRRAIQIPSVPREGHPVARASVRLYPPYP